MRQIKFRGKSNTGVWVYGSLVYSENIQPAIYFETGKGNIKSLEWVYVDPETVGQFTTFIDSRNDIYTHDFIEAKCYPEDGNCIVKGIVVMDQGAFCIDIVEAPHNCGYDDSQKIPLYNFESIKNLGNIHDNPELLTK